MEWVGITTDSYIVYFERIKENLRQGMDIGEAVDLGFTRAYRTIIAADTVSLLAAILLYALAVGAVRGFAIALALATALDLLIAPLYTRRGVTLLAGTGLGWPGREEGGMKSEAEQRVEYLTLGLLLLAIAVQLFGLMPDVSGLGALLIGIVLLGSAFYQRMKGWPVGTTTWIVGAVALALGLAEMGDYLIGTATAIAVLVAGLWFVGRGLGWEL